MNFRMARRKASFTPRTALNISGARKYIAAMRVLCVGRHPFLSEHLGRFFEKLGVETVPCVGMCDAEELVRQGPFDAVICEYDLLATISLANWESDPTLSRVPLIAVSLTRHPGEAHLLDINGIAGFLYLPTLDHDDALRLLAAVQQKRSGITPPTVLPWPGTTPVAQLR
jgi:hypothetical protein